MDDTGKAATDLIGEVIAKQNTGLDLQIICSQYETLGYLAQLIRRRLRCRNKRQGRIKGTIVDGTSVLA